MLWSHVRIVHRHPEENSPRKHILGFRPFHHFPERSNHSVHVEGILNPNIGGLPFGDVDQSHGKRGPLFLRAHGDTILIFGEEFFANLALFDLAGFSKLTWRSVVTGSEGT